MKNICECSDKNKNLQLVAPVVVMTPALATVDVMRVRIANGKSKMCRIMGNHCCNHFNRSSGELTSLDTGWMTENGGAMIKDETTRATQLWQ